MRTRNAISNSSDCHDSIGNEAVEACAAHALGIIANPFMPMNSKSAMELPDAVMFPISANVPDAGVICATSFH